MMVVYVSYSKGQVNLFMSFTSLENMRTLGAGVHLTPSPLKGQCMHADIPLAPYSVVDIAVRESGGQSGSPGIRKFFFKKGSNYTTLTVL